MSLRLSHHRGSQFPDCHSLFTSHLSSDLLSPLKNHGGHRSTAIKSAAKQLDNSLKRLQTDHVDLWQFHENIRLEDPDRFFSDGGSVEAVTDAKKAGKVRYVGFTGHKHPMVHLRMLELASQHGFQFDSCQMPLNVMDAHFRSFTRQVVLKLVELGMGVIGMKPVGDGNVLKSGAVTAMECLHYALSLPTSVVITGCDSMDRLEQALEAVRTFQPDEPAPDG